MRKFILALIAITSMSFVYAQSAADSLKEYTGTYKFPAGSEMTSVEITIQDGALFGTSNLGSGSLTRVNKDTFSIPEHNGTVYFSRNAEKKVVRIHIEVGEMILDGDKDAASLGILPQKQKVND
ncbi:MAG: DUF3471 domain-containing protein [Flavisolibacter sp.]